jgi:glutaredoxin
MEPEKKSDIKSPVISGKGMIAMIVGIVVIIAAIFIVIMMQPGQGTVVPPVVCGPKVITYFNQNLAQQGIATLMSINESKGLYQVTFNYQSQVYTAYATKDCTLLFPTVVNMITGSAAGQVTPQATPQATTAPVKSARPTVDLYVMSFCPYGTQAETSMGPVADLLKSKADFRIRYITTVSGTTADSVASLHGSGEAQEDLRQVCINKYYPEKFWSYINTFNVQCYPSWQNTTALGSCQKKTMAAFSMDSAKIDTCSQGTEGITLLKADQTASDNNHAKSSPMLFINGVLYSGSRTSEAYKQAVCNSFETAPAECSTVVSSTPAPSTNTNTTGGCG